MATLFWISVICKVLYVQNTQRKSVQTWFNPLNYQ